MLHCRVFVVLCCVVWWQARRQQWKAQLQAQEQELAARQMKVLRLLADTERVLLVNVIEAKNLKQPKSVGMSFGKIDPYCKLTVATIKEPTRTVR